MDSQLVTVEEAASATNLHAALKDIAYGSTAGVVSRVVEYPLDLVKVRLQTQAMAETKRFSGAIDCFRQTIRNEGVLALWKGTSMPVVAAMAENATLFLVFNQLNLLLGGPSAPAPFGLASLNLNHLLISSAVSGACVSYVLTPFELVKCKLQVQNLTAPAQGTGALAIARTIYKQHGLRGFWLGQTGTLFRETGGTVAWFLMFEYTSAFLIDRRRASTHSPEICPDTNKLWVKNDLSSLELVLAGGLAGIGYNVSLFPADCIKSTMQTEMDSTTANKSFFQVGRDIYRARGIAGLYAGCGITALRAAPASALIFYIYNRMEKYFG